jgi:hypothetical protein
LDENLNKSNPKKTATETPNHDSDSSSDDGFYITFSSTGNRDKSATADNTPVSSEEATHESTPQSGSAGLQPSVEQTDQGEETHKSNSQSVSPNPTSPSSSHVNLPDDSGEKTHESNSQPVSPNPTLPSSSHVNLPDDSVESKADADNMLQDDDDDQEAFYDASSSLDQQNANDPATERHVTLSDIDKHGKERGIKIPLPAGELSRSRGHLDLSGQSRAQTGAQSSAQSGAQSGAQSSSHRSNSRYGLRPKVTGVKRYGIKSPVKALKKKMTRSKDKE